MAEYNQDKGYLVNTQELGTRKKTGIEMLSPLQIPNKLCKIQACSSVISKKKYSRL